MSQSYREPVVDDTVCAFCAAPLPATVEPFTWPDNGFCSVACAVRFSGAIHVRGTVPVQELASMAGWQGGPGFESLLLKWMIVRLRELPADIHGILTLDKVRSEDDRTFPGAARWPDRMWSWRIYRADQSGTFTPICDALRFTGRQEPSNV